MKMGNSESVIHSPPQKESYEYLDHPNFVLIQGDTYQIGCLYFDNKQSTTNVICHGIRCDILDGKDLYDKLPTTSNHIIFDPFGYGMSNNGKPLSEQGCVESLNYTVKWVQNRNEKIRLIGHSMGTCTLTKWCADTKYEGNVILISPFKSIGSFIHIETPMYNTMQYIKDSICTFEFYHGKLDDMIPYSHTMDLSSIHGSKCVLFENRNHVNILDELISIL
jgi:pimeloyl-ACP methyl ester carboxylesterase